MVEFITGDSREALRGLPDGSVNCVITSPPYFGLRDYGVSGQIGLEPTLEAYINELMAVFTEVKRVLRDDGTFWLNLGDSYNSNSSRRNAGFNARYHGCSDAGKQADTDLQKPERPRVGAISSKDLIGMPWRVAFALQADGWILRSDIIWAKGNPMPESVTDRPTRCHEYLFMFAKSERYFYDYAAVREEGVLPAGTRGAKGSAERAAMAGVNSRPPEYKVYDGFRNRRSVWNVNTRPFPGAHFATFPPALVEPALLAGTSEKGICAVCGAPWVRLVKREVVASNYKRRKDAAEDVPGNPMYRGGTHNSGLANNAVVSRETVGWEPSCSCGCPETVPAVCLDPFAGAGTVGLVAQQHGRNAILVELNPSYVTLAKERLCAAT